MSRFEHTYCSQCGGQFGPGDDGYSSCADHPGQVDALLQPREARMVVIERDAADTPIVWCDPEIVDLVGALNAAGVKTVASCSGHGTLPGWIALSDGRELIVGRNAEDRDRMLAVFGIDVNGTSTEGIRRLHDAEDTLVEEGWIWDGDQWQRPVPTTECTTCGALVVGIASREQEPDERADPLGADISAIAWALNDPKTDHRWAADALREALRKNDERKPRPSPASRTLPMTDEQITAAIRDLGVGAYRTLAAAFKAGVITAEAHALASRPEAPVASEISKLRALAATCYAGLGAECNLPEHWLDVLSAAANGDPFNTEDLLPFKASVLASPSGAGLGGAVASSEAADLPSPQEMADRMAKARRGFMCPLCGRDYPHQHSPEEITIYRNGMKWGRNNGNEPWTGEIRPSAAQDAGHDAGAIGAARWSGADQHLQHRIGQADDHRAGAECDSEGAGVSSESAVRETAVAASRVIEAWESSPLRSNDGMLFERIEDLRAALASQPGCAVEGEAVAALKWCAAALQALIDSRGESGAISMIVSGEKKSLEEVLDMADAALQVSSTEMSGGA